MERQAERRQATVIFAEVVGFDRLSESLEAEELTELMNGCFEVMGEVIDSFGGRIDKFIGETVMVVFGAPVAIEDAPARALNTAIALRRAVGEFQRQRELSVPLELRAGVNTGTVLAGAVGARGRREFTVMGDAVNLAARLQDMAESGRILVGPTTHRITNQAFSHRSLGLVEIKGKAQAVQVHELVSERERLGARDRLDGRQLRSALVGREPELGELVQAARRLAEGQGGIVRVIGEAGIGKSRLLAELRQRSACDGVTLLEGRGLSMGRNLSFHPFVDLFRNWARITEHDRDELAIGKLERLLAGIHPRGRAEIMPFLLTLMGLSVPEVYAERLREIEREGLEKLVYRTIDELVSRASAERPVLACFEDLHWADASSLRLLAHLLSLADEHPVLFVLVHRPGYDEVLAPLDERLTREGAPACAVLSLQPLDPQASQELLDGLLRIQGLPAGLRGRILERAGGNPFFIEEVLRSLIDQGAIAPRGDGFVATERIAAVEIPLTINEVIMTRIDRLDAPSREVLRTASVLGRTFFYRVLAEVLGSSAGLDGHLDQLVGAQMLRRRTRLEELEYLFKHALAQEVAYDSLLGKERRELHLQAARAIEATFSHRLTEFYGMLAWHYSSAEELDQAEEYMMKAGEEASRASASSEALHFYKRALELYTRKGAAGDDSARLVRLEEGLGRTLMDRGHMEEAIVYLGRAMERLGSPRPRTRMAAYLKLGRDLVGVLWRLYLPRLSWLSEPSPNEGHIAELFFARGAALGAVDPMRFFMESIEGTRRILTCGWQRVSMGAETLSTSATAFSWTGISTGVSRRILDRVNYDELSTRKQRLYYRFGELVHRLVVGDWDLPYDPDLVAFGVRTGAYFPATGSAATWGLYLVERGEYDTVQEIVDTLLRVAEDYSDSNARSFAVKVRTQLALRRRDFVTAASIDDGLEANLDIGQESRSVTILSMRARACVLQGQFDRAEQDLARAEEFMKRHGVTPHDASYLYAGRLALSLARWESVAHQPGGARDQAAKTLRRASRLALRSARKVPAERALVFRLMGRQAWLRGKHGAALRWWGKALSAAERLGARPEHARTLHEAGLRMSEEPTLRLSGRDSDACLAEARRAFDDLGLSA